MEVASIIKKENIGWVVSPGDHSALAEAILEGQKDKSLMKKGHKSRILAEEYYSYKRILLLYKEALNNIHA